MKNVVITGSTRGIGLSMAREFLRAGCNVTLSGRHEVLPEAAHSALSSFEGKYIYVPCNVQEKVNLQKLWDVSFTQWDRIDIWINNAGQNTPYMFLWETDESYTENTVKTNIMGVIYGSQVAAAGMLKQGVWRNIQHGRPWLKQHDTAKNNTVWYHQACLNLLYERACQGAGGHRSNSGTVISGDDAD
jgi:short-subunit dehydrogenase